MMSDHTQKRVVAGAAAVKAGSPDYEENDAQTNAVDTIANILHWLASEEPFSNPASALISAQDHFEAESCGKCKQPLSAHDEHDLRCPDDYEEEARDGE